MIHTYTPIVRHLEAWAAAHLGNPDSAEYLAYHRVFSELLAVKRAEQSEAHDNCGAFGMSGAAGCMRAMAIGRAEKMAGRREVLTGSQLGTFEIGHLLEIMTLAILKVSGVEVDSTQAEAAIPPAHHSYADGIVRSLPGSLVLDGRTLESMMGSDRTMRDPMLLSVKSVGYKSAGRAGGSWKRYGFAALPLDGIHKAHPSWYLQAQLEMKALNLKHCLLVVVAKDMILAFQDDEIMQESGSLTWYAELLAYDDRAATGTSAAYSKILTSDPMTVPPLAVHPAPNLWFVHLPRPGDVASGWQGPNKEATSTFNPCFGCGFSRICRGEVKA